MLTFVDLFCGIGSFHYSFQKLGFKCKMACDNYIPAQQSYLANYGEQPLGDVQTIDPSSLGSYDVLCAGFPCQPFSHAGQRKGFADDRGTLFDHVMRFVTENHPRAVVLENVPGIINHDNGKTLQKITDSIAAEGYNVMHRVLKCSDYGIPQMRKRLFIVGICKYEPAVTKDAFFDTSEYKSNKTLTQFMGRQFAKDVAYTIRCGGRHSALSDRHNWDGYIVDGSPYRLTIDDALRLQGFDGFHLAGSDADKWRMLGNTIPTVLTNIIGRQLLKHLSPNETDSFAIK